MKIKNFDKISGYTYKGFSIVNPMHNADETKYFATVLNLNNPQKPKWELSVITSEHKWLIGDSARGGAFIVILKDDEGTLVRDANGQMQFISPEALQTFKEKLAVKYKVPVDSVITYDEMKNIPVGKEPKYNVIVKPGDGDESANRADVVGTWLLIH